MLNFVPELALMALAPSSNDITAKVATIATQRCPW